MTRGTLILRITDKAIRWTCKTNKCNWGVDGCIGSISADGTIVEAFRVIEIIWRLTNGAYINRQAWTALYRACHTLK